MWLVMFVFSDLLLCSCLCRLALGSAAGIGVVDINHRQLVMTSAVCDLKGQTLLL